MTKDTHKTAVIFRKIKMKKLDEFYYGEIIAIFPYLIEDYSRQYLLCYSFACQHGSCDYNYIGYISEPAKEEEYRDMKNHLENDIGYNLKVAQKIVYDLRDLSISFYATMGPIISNEDTRKVAIERDQYGRLHAIFPYTVSYDPTWKNFSIWGYDHYLRRLLRYADYWTYFNSRPCSKSEARKVMDILEICCPYELTVIKEIDVDKVKTLQAMMELKR